jgi:APA family basic amino acid/polyamine antiporter
MTQNSELIKGIGFLALVASCFNCTVGGGIFRLPATVYSIAGTLSPIVFLLCFFTMLLVAGVFIQVGRTIRVSGGPYAYVKPVLGDYFGFICGVLLWILATLAFASISNAYAHFVALALPGLENSMSEPLILAVSLAGLALFNARGVKSGAKISMILALIKILPLAFLIVIGLPHLNADALALPEQWNGENIARGAMILIFAFTGMESALIPSGEIENPEKTLPRTLMFSSTLVLILYLGVQFVSQSVLGSELGQPGISPLALAAEKMIGPSGALILGIGAIFSTFGYLSAMTLSLPRSLLAFAENGYLPRIVGRISEKSKAPVLAIWIQVLITFILAVTNQFEKLAILANLSAILMYLLCAIAAIKLARSNAKAGRINSLIPLGAILTMGFLLTSVTIQEWVSVLTLIVSCSLGYFWKNHIRTRPVS